MSTADSLVIAISQLVTVEVIYPLRPDASPRAIAWSGRLASLATIVVASLIGLAWKDGITALSRIQFPLSAQAAPAFLLGLYTQNEYYDCHPWSIAVAAVLSTIYAFGIIFGYLGRENNPVAIDAGLTGIALNFCLVLLLEMARRLIKLSPMAVNAKKTDENVEGSFEENSKPVLLFPLRPEWDVPGLLRFGDSPLTSRLIWKSMKGVREPFSNVYWVALVLLSITICTPIVPPSVPPIEDEEGIPWWAKKSILANVIPFAITLVEVLLMPTSFPIDEENIEAIDPNLVELTVRERAMRTSYDSTNTLILSRRSVISKTLDDIQSSTQSRLVDNSDSMQSRRRLSALLIKPDEKLDEDEGGCGGEDADGLNKIPELDSSD